MTTARALRFGASISDVHDGSAWRARAREVEELGFDALLLADFPPLPAPIPMLATAAAVTERIRLGTYVLDPTRRDAATAVHELATLDRISGGRLDVGLGLGLGTVSDTVVVRGSVDVRGDSTLADAGATTGRVGRLRALIEELDRALAGERPHARFAQSRPPLLIGGGGPRLQQVAAERGDRFVLSGPRDKAVYPALTDFESTRQAFEAFRHLAGARADAIELGLNLQFVVVTEDREAAAAEIRELHRYLTVAQILESPRAAIGTHEEIAAQLRHVAEAMRVTCFNVLGANLDDFAPVIELIRSGQEREP